MSVSECKGSSRVSSDTFLKSDRQNLPTNLLTLRESRSTEKICCLCKRRLSQPIMGLKNQRSKVLTPKKVSKNGLVNIVYNFMRNHRKSLPMFPTVGQEAEFQKKEFTPRKTRSNGNGSENFADCGIFQTNMQMTSGPQVHENITPRKTKDNKIVTANLSNTRSCQKTQQAVTQISVSQNAAVSTSRRKINTNGVFNDILLDPMLSEEPKKLTHRRTRSIAMMDGIISHSSSPQRTAQTVVKESVSERVSTPTQKRSNSVTNGVLLDLKEVSEATPKRSKKNGILSDYQSFQSASQRRQSSLTEEIVKPTPLMSRKNGKKLNGVTVEKTQQNGLVKRRSSRNSVNTTAQKTIPVIQTKNIVIKLERLTFDADGVITWPKALKGRRVDAQQALNDLEECEEELQTTQRKHRKYPAPRNGKDTYSKEYVVERFVDQEFDAKSKMLMFFVKWKGFPTEYNTWEPLHHLQHCTVLLTQFLAERLGAQVLDELCEKLNISSRLSDQELLEILKVTDLNYLPDKILLQEKLLRLVAIPPKERHVRKLENGKKTVLMYQLMLRREQQLKKLKAWEDSINEMTKEEALITIENTADLECPPEGFSYIHENIPTNGIVIPSDPERWCECEECGPRQDCCGKQPHNGFTYKISNKINVNPGNAVYECNKKCRCSQDCRNRVVQKGRKVPLCIFRTSNGCGWGVKTMRKIHCGEFVCEYVGEIITHEEAEVRGRAYDQDGRTYLFDLDFNSKDNPYTVDAAKFGNISHFINHSCDPNLGVYAVWIDCSDSNMPRLALFALREIQRDEEITFDYMMNIDPEVPTTPEKPRFLHTPDKNQVIQNGRNICKCDADACRKYLF